MTEEVKQVLSEIRKEIQAEYDDCNISDYTRDMCDGLKIALDIIDKHIISKGDRLCFKER